MRLILAGALLSTMALSSTAANAIPIPQYDKMSAVDESRYTTSLLKGCYAGLKAHSQNDQAKKLMALFADASNKGGASQFEKNLQIARMLNQRNVSDSKFMPYEVENAFAVTLKDNGIIVPISFLLTINKDFKPTLPPER